MTAPVGRIVHTRVALPAVLPVNFRPDRDGAVVLRTAAASEWAHAVAELVTGQELLAGHTMYGSHLSV
ncbi:pyridoxamine 5'-phosphate oxidase family protein [Streptomyces sp. NPDC054783]